MPMKRNRGKTANLGPDTKNKGGFVAPAKYNERNVNAGGAYVGGAPGLTRDTTPRVIKGPGRG